MINTVRQLKNWWRRQDASTAKEVLSRQAGSTGKHLLCLSVVAMLLPAKEAESALSQLLGIDMTGFLSIGDGYIAAYMLAFSMVCFAVAFVLSLKPKTRSRAQVQTKAKKKP